MLKIQDVTKNTLANRMIHLPCMQNRTLTRIFRPGNREVPHEKSLYEGQLALAKIIRTTGVSSQNIKPEFMSEIYPVRILSSNAITFGELNGSYFKNSGKWITDQTSLAHELSLIYNLSPLAFNDNYCVTITDYEYLDSKKVRIV